jgi:hypothetical protein
MALRHQLMLMQQLLLPRVPELARHCKHPELRFPLQQQQITLNSPDLPLRYPTQNW